MISHEIPLSSIENMPDPNTEDDLIGQIDAKIDVHNLFSSGQLRDKHKVVMALKRDLYPVELKGARVDVKGTLKTIGEIANSLPDNTKTVSYRDLSLPLDVTPVRVLQIENRGFRIGKTIVSPPLL